MARRTRCSDAGYVYHVLNRAVGRATLFGKPADYAAFEKVLCQAWERTAMRLLSYVVLPNHWHLAWIPMPAFQPNIFGLARRRQLLGLPLSAALQL
ncbi:MAG TPA: hypothetical protein VG099_10265 [Gemmataceae bacterium]|jgi:putative transposase|nr:hypothetical protein [Gemmataceae bacterium]